MKSTSKTGIALLIAGVIILIVVGVGAFPGFSDLVGKPGEQVSCRVSVANYAIVDPKIIDGPTCVVEDCTNFLSFWSDIGYTDVGTVQMFLEGSKAAGVDYSINEGQTREYTLISKCLEAGAHNVQIKLFDSNGAQVGGTKELVVGEW